MKKLFTLLTMLIVGIGSMWATDVTVIDRTKNATTYGSHSGTVFTTNDASGMAGVTISGITGTTATTFAYGACLALTSTSSGTITMTAPEGYIITGYTLTARSNTWSVPYTLTPYVGGSAVTTSTGGVNLTASGLGAQTASFTYSAGSANSFYIPSMSITVISEETVNLINVTYELYESDGTTLVSSDVIRQVENSAIQIPSSFTAATYYDYTTTGTIGSSDCTIKVTRTLKSGYVISLDGLSNSKCYNIRNNRGTWAVGSGATVVNSTYELGLAFLASDTKQQFAFVKYIDKYYLYSVSENKFAYVDDTKLSLTADVTNAVAASPVTFQASTAPHKDSEPIIVTIGGNMYGVSTGKSPDVFKYNNHPEDDGNCAIIIEAGEFNPAAALSKIENSFLFEPSTDLAPKYYAWRTAVGNKPSYIHIESGAPKNQDNHNITVTDPIDATYAWYFIGDPENGYAIKNKSTGTYLGGRTASGGNMSMETSANCKFYPINEAATTPSWNTWYDKAHNFYIDRSGGVPYAHTAGNKNDYVRLYNVKFSLSDAAAGLVVGSTTISDFSAYYLITTSAVLSCAESNYEISAYDGYATLAEALENDADGIINLTIQQTVDVTYKMMFNGSVIRNEVVTEAVGVTASTPSAWTVPAYCSFTCPSTTITAETTEIEVTLTWDGPFDISSDFNSAKWYYLKVNEKYAVYGKFKYNNNPITQPYDNEADAKNTIANSMWAFVGNPYDGFEILNRFAGSDKYLNSQSGTAMFMSSSNEFTTFKIGQKEGTVFSMNNGGYYINCGNAYIAANSGVSENATSSLTVEDIPYKFLALAYLPEYAASHHMGEYFGVDESSYNTVKNSVSDLESMTENDYNQFVSSLNTLLSPKLPETGYYRIKSSGSRGGESYISYGWFSDAKGTGLVTTRNDKMTDCGTVVKLTHVGNGQTYQISIQGLNVQAHTADNTLFRATDGDAVNFTFNHINHSGMCSIFDGTNHGYIHEAAWYDSTTKLNGVVGWGTGNASSWSLEDASTCTVNLNSDGAATPTYYATFCAPFSYTVSDGTKAYTLEQSGEWLVPTEIEGEVAAGTPVLLKGTSATATLTIGSGYAESPLATTALTGTYVATTVDTRSASGNNYVFGKNSSGAIGFYHVNNQYFPLKANRAYMNTSASNARGFSLMFDDVVTGIVSTSGETEEGAVIYNISGQRLNKMQKGINIVNGKKVLF